MPINESSFNDLRSSLAKLQNHEKELLNEIARINKSFDKLGVPNQNLRDGDSNAGYIKSAGLVIQSRLSFRGKDKASEYFRFVDTDKDELITYEEMRGSTVYQMISFVALLILLFLIVAVHAFGDPYAVLRSVGFQSR
jgi:hypothetical protein